MFIARTANPKNHVKALIVGIFITVVASLYLFGAKVIAQSPTHKSMAAQSMQRTLHRYSTIHEKPTPTTSDTVNNLVNTTTALAMNINHNTEVARGSSHKAAALSKTTKVQPPKPSYHIGQTRGFSIYDDKGRKERTLKAKLLADGKHTYIWVDSTKYIPKNTLSKLITRFDKGIYSRDMDCFSNASGRKRAKYVNILITDLNGLDGYFDANDLSGQNKMKLLYLDGDLIKTTPGEAYNTLAHEFEHLLFYLSNGADVEWLDEGMAVYAEYINGGFPTTYVDDYLRDPNVNLATGFTTDDNNSYGAAFLFVAYAANQVTQSHASIPKFTRALIENSPKGLNGVNIVLHRYSKNRYKDSYGEIYKPQQLVNFGTKLQNKAQ
ncbi:MAG: hypothetical protein ACYC56_11050 [Candidatus Aquicultor sp.]